MAEAAFTAAQSFAGPSAPSAAAKDPPHYPHTHPDNIPNHSYHPLNAPFPNLVQSHSSQIPQVPVSAAAAAAPAPALPFAPSNQRDPPGSNDGGTRYSGVYASTGFDMLSILSRVSNRPNPQINIGPVDLSSSFVVVDARQYDLPIIYASPTFERLTGYTPAEAIGRNCRFLQAPDGHVIPGSRRRYTDNETIYHIKTRIAQGKESQSSVINYRKNGQPFVNLLTVIPITWESDDIDLFVGLQVDLVEQPNAIIQSMRDGSYMINYRSMVLPPSMRTDTNEMPLYEWTRPTSPPLPPPERSEQSPLMNTRPTSDGTLPEPGEADTETLIKEAHAENIPFKRRLDEILIDECPDFIHVLTIKGVFLFCSESAQKILEYRPGELEGKSLKDICHPADITTVLRELKQASNDADDTVNMIYRIRRKHSGYMWIECSGKLRNEDGRGRKYIVLSGRERPQSQLSIHALSVGRQLAKSTNPPLTAKDTHKVAGMYDHAFWIRMTQDGLMLYASSTCTNILGYATTEISGSSLYHLVRRTRPPVLARCLNEAGREGKIVQLHHAMLHNTGFEMPVVSMLYPDGNGYVAMHVQMSSEDANAKVTQEFMSVDPDIKKKGRSGPHKRTPSPNDEQNQWVVPELDIAHTSNWQYELHQLRISNKKLREDLLDAMKNITHEPYCTACLRRLPGSNDLPKEDGRPLLCNTCTLKQAL
ncbi:hypothetical protein BCR43DRAFT_436173 [Syncephalastrum racemosum]|uniref:PAS domain-containing protein n=1 Tax=Syncephalastrum racemosum TaxID=13706 RepID=A0A1X2HHG5_SYNRA|nr:hypothetical protein BCR43DRAFT_436173 [Syncephalastrum racemosum]